MDLKVAKRDEVVIVMLGEQLDIVKYFSSREGAVTAVSD